MKRKWKHWAVCALIVAGSAASAVLLSRTRFFQLLNLKALDAHFVARYLLEGRPPTPDTMLVVADQKSLDTFPELRIFWHPYYAEAIRAAGDAGARVIGLDVAFGVPVDKWEPDHDRVLAEAVSVSPVPVVCGYVTSLNAKQREWPIPINMIAASLGLSAFANLTVDPDDFVRNQVLIEAPSANAADAPPARGMAMRLAEKWLGTEAELRNGGLILAGHPIPVSPDRTIAINYAGPPDTFPRVSLADFIAAARAGNKPRLRQWVAGKAVLIGADAVDDRYPTPFYTLFSGPRWTTAGVEIHANTFRTLIERQYILRVPEWARIASLLLASALICAIATRLAAGPAAGLLAAEALLIFVFTHLLFRAGWILSTSELMAAGIVCVIASVVYRFSTAERRGNLFHRAVSLFVGKELASSLDETQHIGLCGKRLTVTILFTDIRGFTAFSEQLCDEQGPEKLVQLLNDYMGAMCSIVVRHGGRVNKFIGDGILAIFSDEDERASPGDHPLRAVQCATEMVSLPSEFKTGAGIHTGPAVVGNVGSADKMEYTVLGDTVNLASRLESLNKEHKTKLLMSEATQVCLGGQVDTVHLAAVPVRGKTAPINLYTVASLLAANQAAAAADRAVST